MFLSDLYLRAGNKADTIDEELASLDDEDQNQIQDHEAKPKPSESSAEQQVKEAPPPEKEEISHPDVEVPSPEREELKTETPGEEKTDIGASIEDEEQPEPNPEPLQSPPTKEPQPAVEDVSRAIMNIVAAGAPSEDGMKPEKPDSDKLNAELLLTISKDMGKIKQHVEQLQVDKTAEQAMDQFKQNYVFRAKWSQVGLVGRTLRAVQSRAQSFQSEMRNLRHIERVGKTEGATQGHT